MQIEEVFLLQLGLSLLVTAFVASTKLSPVLARLGWRDVVFWLALPHAFRHLGLVFVVPGVVSPDLPAEFANEAAYGDLSAGVLGMATITAAYFRSRVMVPLAWALTIVGSVDLANALQQAHAIPYLHSAWYIPTFIVPVLLVTHAMMLTRLSGLVPRGGRAQA
ncbi:MAG: hypothetical protein AAGF53_16725 [Pseudomonadota bacterium]